MRLRKKKIWYADLFLYVREAEQYMLISGFISTVKWKLAFCGLQQMLTWKSEVGFSSELAEMAEKSFHNFDLQGNSTS